MSTSSIQANTVTEDRKRELLMEARRARLSWIQSSLPYKHSNEEIVKKSNTIGSSDKPDRTDNDNIDILKDAPIAKHLPSAIPVLNNLLQSKSDLPIQAWTDKIKTRRERIQSEALVNALDDHAFIFYYQEILQRLSMPESMDLVQGIRHFVRSFSDLAKQPGQAVHKLVSSIQKHMESVYSVIAVHSSWRGDNTHETKMMLETFVYSKCNGMILDALRKEDDGGDNAEENKFTDRLEFLQFIQPSHLEIDCFPTGEVEDSWKDILSKPITLLQSIDRLYSPTQMLRCVLEVYRGVNDALKTALASEKALDGSSTRMPSADDILPTLILTLICARPNQILTNLKFLELFATQEQMRGEAGYAFTNLFSATQFIRELDLDREGETENGGPTLKIDSADLKQKLSMFQDKVNESRIDNDDTAHDATTLDGESKTSAESNTLDERKIVSHVHLPVSELTAARLRGEDITQWAMKWIDEKHTSSLELHTASGEKTAQTGDETALSALQATTQPSLPDGFKRSYQFLATEPDDIRMSDIPALLEEYRMLVRTTEILLVGQSNLASKQRDLAMISKKGNLEVSLAQASNVMEEESN
jgi:hypothetical protein